MQLNAEQEKVVGFKGGTNCIVNAGPGSGKTRCVTIYVGRLLKEGVSPTSLFVCTFTKDAANEMTERIMKDSGPIAKRLRIGTTHSLFFKILKDIREFQGVRNKIKILTGGYQFKMFLDFIKEDELNCNAPLYYIERISALKNKNISPTDYMKQLSEDKTLSKATHKNNNTLAVARAYLKYEQRKRKERLVDFDDMLTLTLEELKDPKNEQFVTRLRKSIKQIIVDEAQDLNSTQYELLELISNGKNLMLVLDDFQAIYGWRGSHLSLLFNFIEKYKPTIYNVTKNYRSPSEHIHHANSLIKHNTKQISKVCEPATGRNRPPTVMISNDPEHEAEQIFAKIESLVADGVPFNDICILYRTNAQSRALYDLCCMYDIPVRISGGFTFYDRADVKELVSYLKIIISDEADLEDFKRVINKPNRYVSGYILDKVDDYAFDKDITFYEALKAYKDVTNVKYGVARNIDEFLRAIHKCKVDYNYRKLNTTDLLTMIIREFGYDKVAVSKDDLMDDGQLTVESVISSARNHEKPEGFIDFVESAASPKPEDQSINMMTVHGSKGLEFPVVFVIGMCDKIMPYYRCSTTEELEEERRIAYVAVTRSKDYLYLSTIFGYFGRMKVLPSPYITQMGLTLPPRLQDRNAIPPRSELLNY